MKKSFALYSMFAMAAMMGEDFGMSYGRSRKNDKSHKCLPYFYFTHDGKRYEIQAVNEVAAKAKFEKIISKHKIK